MITKDNETDISKIAVDSIFTVYKTLGPGLLENTYQECLYFELRQRNLKVEKEKTLPVHYTQHKIEIGYRLDLLIENQLIIKLKCVEKIMPIHTAQILTYLKLSKIKTGLLINFNTKLIKDGIKRYSI